MASARAILHIDMDAFYASVEQRDTPELFGQPVIVGGHPQRGVVLAASYEVRRFGVKSAMSMTEAVRRAPDAIVVPPRFSAYAEASERIHEIFEDYTPLIEPLSLDEAFLDVTGSLALFGSPETIAKTIRDRIRDELALPASAGIAATKFLAKILSDLAKPNGQMAVAAGQEAAFLAPLPVKRLWGVGPKTEESLARQGIRTIGELAAQSEGWVENRFMEQGRHLFALSRGLDDRPVIPDRGAKSIGAEETFEEDLGNREALSAHIHAQALRVARRLRRSGRRAKVVVLKLKQADFKLLTRRVTLPEATDDGQVVFEAARTLLYKEPLRRKIRLTGVSVQNFTDEAGQLPLFAREKADKSRRLNATLDAITDRFGARAVTTADVAGVRAAHDTPRLPKKDD